MFEIIEFGGGKIKEDDKKVDGIIKKVYDF